MVVWRVAVAAVVLLATRASATTFVAMHDRDLARVADAVVVGTVLEMETVGDRLGSVNTLITIAVEDTLKGTPGPVVVLKQPGGMLRERGMWIAGSPEFRTGERQLVFLSVGRDGTPRTTAYGLGQYRLDTDEAGVPSATRRLAADVVNGDRVRRVKLDRLVRTIRRALATEAVSVPPAPLTVPNELTDPSVERMPTDAFTLMDSPRGRWAEPDRDAPIHYDVDVDGDRALGAEATLAAVDEAMAAWTNVLSATPRLVRDGDAELMPLLCDGRSQLVFSDPFDEMPRPVRCSGILALGGYCVSRRFQVIDGVRVFEITEGNVTFNRGFGGCDFWTPAAVAEITTHELGHTLGIGHASEEDDERSPVLKDATMYYRAHFDGRGASLHADDVAALRAVYPGPPELDDADADDDDVVDALDNCPGNDPTAGIANTAQTDLDADGVGDLCDPCPLTPGIDPDSCGRVHPSRLRAANDRVVRVEWRGDVTTEPPSATSARVVLVAGTGVLIDTALAARSASAAGTTFRRTQSPSDAVVRIRRKKDRWTLRLSVENTLVEAGKTPILTAAIDVGGQTYVTALSCRVVDDQTVRCRS